MTGKVWIDCYICNKYQKRMHDLITHAIFPARKHLVATYPDLPSSTRVHAADDRIDMRLFSFRCVWI